MDKSLALKYFNEIYSDLDAVTSDFFFALKALKGTELKDSDLVKEAIALHQRLDTASDELCALICEHDAE